MSSDSFADFFRFAWTKGTSQARRAIVLLLLLATLSSTFAQSSWTRRDSGTDSGLWGLAYRFADSLPTSSLAVAVGENGVILVSTDDGMTWTPRVSGTTAWLTA